MTELKDIGVFQVTDRSLNAVKEVFGLPELDIVAIPLDSRVLNVGSGLTRKFERELRRNRPDIRMSSIDPSLDVVTVDESGLPSTQGFKITTDDGLAIYNLEGARPIRAEKWVLRGREAVEYDKKRKDVLAQSPGAVAALASALPFRDNSFDVIFDAFGPIQYLKTYDAKKNICLN